MPDDLGFIPDKANLPETPDSSPESFGFVPDDQTIAKEHALQSKYGTAGQQAIAGVEGLAKGLAGPLATAGETKLLGVAPEDIAGRAEANPITHYGSEAAGLIGGSVIPGIGEATQAGVLGKVGSAVSEGLGLSGAVGTAAKLGLENALYTIGDETSKAIMGNPASIQTAATHVGLSGLLGSGLGLGLGKVSELWTSKIGPKAETFLQDFVGRLSDPARDAMEVLPELATPGSKAADMLSKQAENAAADVLASTAGGLAGKLSGIPGGTALGGLFGHYALKPFLRTIMPALVGPLKSMAPSAEGLMSAMAGITAVAKGEALLNDSAKALFEVGSSKAISDLVPDKGQMDKLMKSIHGLQENPESISNSGGKLSHYLPEHATVLSATAQAAVNYLDSQKPSEVQAGVLDRKMAPSPDQLNNYHTALEIAQSPLMVLSHIKNGTLLPEHIEHLKNLYPALFPSIVSAVTNSMLNHLSNGGHVPFKMRQGLGQLIGQPVDSTFSQASMAAAQQTFVPPQRPQDAPSPKKGASKLGMSAKLAMTPSDARQRALNKT